LYYSLYNNELEEYHKQRERINLEIKEAFDKLKIERAFPTQKIIIKKY
jgi:small-conductance mechanosensitive channel